MKKLITGVIIGILISTSFSVYADSLIGKTIKATFPLFIDGEQASQNVIVVEGTSYLPVRAAGEMFGYDVRFDSESNEVFLDKAIITNETTIQEEGEKVDVIKEAFTSAENVTAKSNTLDLYKAGNKEFAETRPVKIDGEWFVSYNVLQNYANLRPFFDDPLILTFPNKEPITIDTDLEYSKSEDIYFPGINYFKLYGSREVIKLSYLGLTGEMKDGMFWIEAQ